MRAICAVVLEGSSGSSSQIHPASQGDSRHRKVPLRDRRRLYKTGKDSVWEPGLE
jgi:hypothetical protein